MINKQIGSVVFICLLMSCNHAKKSDETIVGSWTMYKVFESGVDMTAKHNPAADRWICFKSDGTFISGGKPFGTNAGRWSTDNKQSILYIDSDVVDDDSEWRVTFTHNQMIWTGIGHPRKENTKLIHIRMDK